MSSTQNPAAQEDAPKEAPQREPEDTKSSESETAPGDTTNPHGVLAILRPSEIYWRDQYEWLLAAGYRLRDRYKPDWVPSWAGKKWEPRLCEDSHVGWFPGPINYAIRTETGKFVTLKKVNKTKHPQEVAVMRFLLSESLAKDPRNHSSPLIDVLEHPTDTETCFLVVPLLRDYDDPPFRTNGEAVDFLSQFLTGLHFLHDQGVSHGDLSINNILMDADGMYPKGFHPVDQNMLPDFTGPAPRSSRTEKPPTYYLIDFGHAEKWEEGAEPPSTTKVGTDLTVPEYEDESQDVNPFKVDVYCAGNLIKYEFLDGDPRREGRPGYFGFEWLRPLITDMLRQQGAERPSMEEVVSRFHEAVSELSTSYLRSRCVKRPAPGDRIDHFPITFFTSMNHWYKRMSYAVRRIPPIPKRST